MSEQITSCKVVLTNPQGLHLRAADLFVRLAAQFPAKIEIVKGEVRVNGKGVWDILTLGAPQGTELIIEASGPDAAAAVEALARLVTGGFSEHESQT